MITVYFLVAFWGDKYRNYFEDCLWRSLAPQMHFDDKFIIAAPTKDFAKLPGPIKARSRWVHNYFDFTKPIYWNQNEAQKALYQWCFDNKVVASMQSPDIILSQGYRDTLQRYYDKGYDVVQYTALRQNESTFLAEVGSRRIFQPRELAALNIKHLHRECDPLYEGDPRQPWMPPLRLWKTIDGDLIIRSFVANPILMNFAKLRYLNLRCVRHIAVENIFLDYNFRGCKFGLVTDSDEIGICSLSADYPSPYQRPRNYSQRWRALGLQMSYYLWPRAGWIPFQTPAIWHAKDMPRNVGAYPTKSRSVLAFILGWMARIYLLHALPWAARQKRRWN